jgi:hypothetical protein
MVSATLEEVVLNADVTLFCHTSSILWVRFISVLEYIARLESGDINTLGTFRKLFDLWLSYLRLQPAESSALGQLLEVFDDFGCADGRDRIFALLSLHQGDYSMKADCTLTTSEVYLRFAEEVIRGGLLT